MISEFLMKIPFVDDFEIETKAGVKCSEKAVRYREEGNKLFQADKCTQVRYIHYPGIPRYTQVRYISRYTQDQLSERMCKGTLAGLISSESNQILVWTQKKTFLKEGNSLSVQLSSICSFLDPLDSTGWF